MELSSSELKQYVPFIIIGMFISMPIMCLLAIIQCFRSNSDIEHTHLRYFVYFMLSLIPALFNTTKPVDYSDLGYYYWLYNIVKIKSFPEFFSMIPREPLFYVYTYIMHYVTLGSFKLYVIVTTLLMYMPIMFAFDIIIRKNELPNQLAVYAVILLVLFPQYFFYTMQIVRQVLAGSLAFYCIVKSLYYPTNRWAFLGVFCAGLIHASAFLFSIFYVFKFTNGWNIKYRILLLVICGLFFYSILGFISSTADETTTLSYAVKRGLADDNDIVNVGIFPRLIALSILPLGTFAAIKIKDKQFTNFIFTAIVIGSFIILKWNTPLMVLRFMEYTYMYIPVLVVLVIYLINKEHYLNLLVCGMFFLFLYSVPRSNFQYESLSALFTKGGLFYLI